MTRGVLVHEWLAKTGGSENVFEAMAAAFPDADLLCLWNDEPGRFGDRSVNETWLAGTMLRNHKALTLPLLPGVWRERRPGGYDWALVSSHLFAHHVSFRGVQSDFRKYAYVYTPARYLWTPELDERGARILPRLISPPLRAIDRYRAREAYSIAAISQFVRERIAVTWQRDSVVIYPPVDVERIQSKRWADHVVGPEATILDALPDTFLLGASRFIPYKRLDLVIEAGESCDVPVVLAGSGPMRSEIFSLAARASVPVTIVDAPSNALLFALYERALAYVFLAVEDFGITPVEAMAAGSTIIARNVGGATETVQDGRTGVLLDSLDRSSLRGAVERAASLDSEAAKQRAKDFSVERFTRELKKWMSDVVQD